MRGDEAATAVQSVVRNDSLRAWASRYARLVLDRTKGNKRAACRVLDISYHTLQAYLRFPLENDANSAAFGTAAPEAVDAASEAAGVVPLTEVQV